MSDHLNSGEVLHVNSSISSRAGESSSSSRATGTWCSTRTTRRRFRASHTDGKPVSQAIMQTDGNFVVYGPSGALWASNTNGAGSALLVQDDGNVVIYDPSLQPRWATNTVLPAQHQPGRFPYITSVGKTAIHGKGYAYINQAVLSSLGRFDVHLRVQNVMLAVGFTGGAKALFVDLGGDIIGEAGWYTLGVDPKGYPFGSSDRTKHFVSQVDQGLINNIAEIHWVFEHRPQQYGAIDQIVAAGKKLGAAAGELEAVGAVIGKL